MDKVISFIFYENHGFDPTTWKGTLQEAINIALTEISEHAGSESAAYQFTNKVFQEMSIRIATKEKKDNYQKCFCCDCYVPLSEKICQACNSDRLYGIYLRQSELDFQEHLIEEAKNIE